jgi:hypothetical protein
MDDICDQAMRVSILVGLDTFVGESADVMTRGALTGVVVLQVVPETTRNLLGPLGMIKT